jgi:hypothetical protein
MEGAEEAESPKTHCSHDPNRESLTLNLRTKQVKWPKIKGKKTFFKTEKEIY